MNCGEECATELGVQGTAFLRFCAGPAACLPARFFRRRPTTWWSSFGGAIVTGASPKLRYCRPLSAAVAVLWILTRQLCSCLNRISDIHLSLHRRWKTGFDSALDEALASLLWHGHLALTVLQL